MEISCSSILRYLNSVKWYVDLYPDGPIIVMKKVILAAMLGTWSNVLKLSKNNVYHNFSP